MEHEMIGKTVKIISERYLGKVGIIQEAFPAGLFESQEVFIVRYSDSLNSGMFTVNEFEVVEKADSRRVKL